MLAKSRPEWGAKFHRCTEASHKGVSAWVAEQHWCGQHAQDFSIVLVQQCWSEADLSGVHSLIGLAAV